MSDFTKFFQYNPWAPIVIFVHFLDYATDHFQTIPKFRECTLHKNSRKNISIIFCHLAKNGRLRLRKFCKFPKFKVWRGRIKFCFLGLFLSKFPNLTSDLTEFFQFNPYAPIYHFLHFLIYATDH